MSCCLSNYPACHRTHSSLRVEQGESNMKPYLQFPSYIMSSVVWPLLMSLSQAASSDRRTPDINTASRLKQVDPEGTQRCPLCWRQHACLLLYMHECHHLLQPFTHLTVWLECRSGLRPAQVISLLEKSG